jgi:hypothetical protein
MKLSLHPEAEADLAEASGFYDRRKAGLGSDFLGEMLLTLERIESAPMAWPLAGGPVRRCLMERFPYAVYYNVDLEIVLEVVHTRRRPGRWKGRL